MVAFANWLEALKVTWLEHWLAWAFFGGYLILTWVVAELARKLMRTLIPLLTSRTNSLLDDRLVDATARPARAAVLTIGLTLSLGALGRSIPSLTDGGAYAVQFAGLLKVSVAVVILAVTGLVNALMKAAVDWWLHEMAPETEAAWDKELLPLVRRLLSMLIYFIGVSIVLETFNVSITALITTAGVASLAIALAAQDTLSNMLGGLVILVDRPFKMGDVIELSDGKSGEVVEIGLRSTRIKLFDGNALVVPNKDMASQRVINYALPNQKAAVRQTIGVSYETDLNQARQVLLAVLQAHPEVLDDPAPSVAFTKFGESTLDLFFSCWVSSYRDRFRVTDELNMQIWKAFREQGIEVAYPQRDVHLFVKEGPTISLGGKE